MFGRGYRYRWFQKILVTSDYCYIVPCRCGAGPHEYYPGRRSRILCAWDMQSGPSYNNENLQGEPEQLKAEKTDIEKQIKEMEKCITNQEKKE